MPTTTKGCDDCPKKPTTTATMLDFGTLIPRCHNAAKANGWWENPTPKTVSLMLVISELAEAMEADRKNRRADAVTFERDRDAYAAGFGDEDMRMYRDNLTWEAFGKFVKDTVEDEIADAIIRLCALAGGWGIGPQHYQEEADDAQEGRLTVGKHPLAEVLFFATCRLTRVLNARDEPNEVKMGEAVGILLCYCKREGIDIARHIDLKLAYNATRGHKHGGKAY